MSTSFRNFAIIAHIDHGKSTLADRFLELTGTVPEKKMLEQFLDRLELERERGITIKMAPVQMRWAFQAEGRTSEVIFHCIDTPGHVDFSYEVSRALKSCEGALLLVDAAQGVQAQTLAHGLLAKKMGLKLLLAVNKIDLKEAKPEEVARVAQHLFGVSEEETFYISAKTGEGCRELLNGLAQQIPAARTETSAPLQALVFDSRYDAYQGVVLHVRLFAGEVKPKDRILLYHSGKAYEVEQVGVFKPFPELKPKLQAGEVGFITAQIKSLKDARVGETVMLAEKRTDPLPGYAPPKPFVFAGLYPSDGESFERLESALLKLQLEDSSLVFEREKSPCLGLGFRAGFLGPLHIEIVQQRLEREYDIDLVVTSASVPYQVKLRSGKVVEITKAEDLPETSQIEAIFEPILNVQVLAPKEYVGKVMELFQNRRGIFQVMDYPSEEQILLRYDLPLRELVAGFYEELKAVSSGFATMDYSLKGFQEGDLVRLDVLVGGQRIGELSQIVSREKAYEIGKSLVSKLKKEIPRHLFEVPVQAAIGSRVIARETIPALRKNVLAKCYGGDVTRKRKLLEKQKEGKKRLKQVGKVSLPQEAFLAVLKK